MSEDGTGFEKSKMYGTHKITLSGDQVGKMLKGTSTVGKMGAWLMTEDGK